MKKYVIAILVCIVFSSSGLGAVVNGQLMQGAGGVTGTMMMIQYIPNADLVKWSVATPQMSAWTQIPFQFDLNDLFTQPTHVIDEVDNFPTPKLTPSPNPLKAGQILKLDAQERIIR